MPYLKFDSVYYNRPFQPNSGESEPVAKVETHNRILRDIEQTRYSLDALIELLKHSDAKIRTLAVVALFDREDPQVLPHLVALAEDGAPTFDAKDPLSTVLEPQMQTVGQIVTRLVGFYLQSSGFHDGINHPTEPGFKEYWEARRNRAYCHGWFALQLERATRGEIPYPEESQPLLAALRKKLDALPADERAWELLALRGDTWSGALFVADAEVVGLCKKLGREKLLALLRDEIPCDDPDLRPRATIDGTCPAMKAFVLRHAVELLDVTDADKLLAYEERDRMGLAPVIFAIIMADRGRAPSRPIEPRGSCERAC